MNDGQREKRFDKAQLKVLFQVPFFAPGAARLPAEFSDEVDTACTDGKRIIFGREFFDKCEDQQLVTLICHEVMHPELGHLWRMPPGADPELWNEACDHAVNNQLKEFSAAVKAKNLADPFPFPDGSYCCDPRFANMSEEQIYQILAAGRPKGGGGGGSGGPGAGKGKPGGKPVPGNGPSRKKFGEFVPASGADPDQKKLKTDWDHTFIVSCELGKGRGELPAGMARILGDLLDPKVPWYELLRQWLREQASDDYTWTKPNRYYSGSDFILPVLESERVGPVIFATDTSGSIDHECLTHFQTEKQSCLDDIRPAKLVDIYCDSNIHKVAEYRVGEMIDKDAPGGGGTNFRPVFEHAAKMDVPPKCLVYLTDLDGTFPDKAPEYPVLWVTWTKGGTVPFGDIVDASGS